MVYEAAFAPDLHTLDDLLVPRPAERQRGEGLRLAADEEAGAVDPRQYAGSGLERAELIGRPAVGPLAGLDDAAVHNGVKFILPEVVDLGGRSFREVAMRVARPLLLEEGERLVARGLVPVPERLLDAAGEALFQSITEGAGYGKQLHGRFGRRRGGDDLALEGNEVFNLALAPLERLDDERLGDLPGAGLDHVDFLRRARDDEVKFCPLAFPKARVHDPGVVASADAHRGHRSVPGDVRERECQRRPGDGGEVGVVGLVEGEDGGHDLHLVSHAEIKARPDGAINEARGENGLLRRPVLAFDEARAENFPRGVKLLLVVHRQREKVPALARPLGHHRGHKHRGVAVPHERAAVGLACQRRQFDRQR